MGKWISNKGVWHPAIERVGLTNKSGKAVEYKGEMIEPDAPFVYEGPNREALKELAEANAETLGHDFRRDPEFLQSMRNMGWSAGEEGVEQYLAFIGYDEKADDERFKKEASKVSKGSAKKQHAEVLTMGGGKDQSGNSENDQIGGFGEQRTRSPKELKSANK